MSHNYAADSTFQDVMARLAGTDAPFSAVWPTIKGAILSGRAMTVAEYRPLNALISEAHATRIARNEALNAPHMHSTVGEVAHSVGAPDETDPAASAPTPTILPANHIEKVQTEVTQPAPESNPAESENAEAASPKKTESAQAATPADGEKADENQKKEAEK